ncbi:MAG: GYD domain-containing protein [Candidatus Binataceae bacterium]
MNTYVMLTKLLPGGLATPSGLEDLNREVNERIKRECSGVKWVANYATLGPVDYVDIFEAPDADTAAKVALLIRSVGRSTAELWTAIPWDRFVDMAKRTER